MNNKRGLRYHLRGPDGEEYHGDNLKEFWREHNPCSLSHLYELVAGKRESVAGWESLGEPRGGYGCTFDGEQLEDMVLDYLGTLETLHGVTVDTCAAHYKIPAQSFRKFMHNKGVSWKKLLRLERIYRASELMDNYGDLTCSARRCHWVLGLTAGAAMTYVNRARELK